jgi:hypothetical protein
MAKKRKGKSRTSKVDSDARHAEPEASAEDYLDADALTAEADESVVVVADFDPTNPGQELAEPTKVLKPNDRLARKAEQRKNLEK